MKIKSGLVLALLVVGLVPVIGFTWFTYQQTLSKEFEDVQDRHLLLAKNISSALSRYEKDVRATINTVASSLAQFGAAGSAQPLLETLHINSVSLVDAGTGVTRGYVSADASDGPERLSPSILEAARSAAKENRLKFSAVTIDQNQYNAMYVLGRRENFLIIAKMSTEYFVKLGDQVTFGKKGHAAIVDQEGNVLAHPLQSWVNSAKNISRISSVQRMLRGETGVEQFYSPALKGDMIAGLTAVEGPGWGVMIPQPVSELRGRAIDNITPLLFGLAFTIALSLSLLHLSLRWVARPLENINQELTNQMLKGVPSQLPPSRAVTRINELTNIVAAYNTLAAAVQKSAQELSDKALQDTVTGIGNRAYFYEKGQKQIDLRTTLSKNGMLILTDLDGFKQINDTRGHAAGDVFLNAYAQRLYASTKRFMDREFRGTPGAHPVIGRIGGDEFAILLPVPDDRSDLAKIGDKLLMELPDFLEVEGVSIPCGISAGGAAYPKHGYTIDALLRFADVALYRSKLNGKNQFTLYDKKSALGGKSEILSAISTAIEQDELVLEYQPKFCLTANTITGVEALLRWNHPRVGQLSPDVFLHAIQQTHVMVELGEWVIKRAIDDCQRFDMQGQNLNIAINIGVEHFCNKKFAERLHATCLARGFRPERLQLEITEDVMMQSEDTLATTVHDLQQAGFTVAIDDFGRGFSNLSRMATVPADVIKLDKSLTSEFINNSRILSVMKSAVDMAHSLGARVVIEGVETLEEVKIAQEIGADALQGYYFSQPLSVAQLTEWMQNAQSSPQHQQMKVLQQRLLHSAV